MASTYTSLGTEQIATGEKINIWGEALNNSVFAPFVQAISGVSVLAVDGDRTITIPNGQLADGRCAVLVLTDGEAEIAPLWTVPAVPKLWWVHNTSDVAVEFTSGNGTAIVRPNSFVLIYSDGTDIVNPEMGMDQLKPITAPFDANGQKITGLANGTASTDAATFGQLTAIAGAADAAEAAAVLAQQAVVQANAALAAINSKFRIVTSLPDPATLPEGAVVFLIA